MCSALCFGYHPYYHLVARYTIFVVITIINFAAATLLLVEMHDAWLRSWHDHDIDIDELQQSISAAT